MRRLIRPTAWVVATLAVFLGTGGAAAAAPAVNGEILFRRYLNDDHTQGAVSSIRSNGTRLFRVTHSGRDQVGTEPNPSPDGRWIAYMIAPENDLDHARLFKIHPNGEGQTALSSTCTGDCQGDGFPNWSPSGRRIAFQRLLSSDPAQPVGFMAIFVMRADGTDVQQITQLSADPSDPSRFADGAPRWAPERSHLAGERFSDSRGRRG